MDPDVAVECLWVKNLTLRMTWSNQVKSSLFVQ